MKRRKKIERSKLDRKVARAMKDAQIALEPMIDAASKTIFAALAKLAAVAFIAGREYQLDRMIRGASIRRRGQKKRWR